MLEQITERGMGAAERVAQIRAGRERRRLELDRYAGAGEKRRILLAAAAAGGALAAGLAGAAVMTAKEKVEVR